MDTKEGMLEVGELVKYRRLLTENGEPVLGLIQEKEKNIKNPGTFVYKVDWVNLEDSLHSRTPMRIRKLEGTWIPEFFLEKVNV